MVKWFVVRCSSDSHGSRRRRRGTRRLVGHIVRLDRLSFLLELQAEQIPFRAPTVHNALCPAGHASQRTRDYISGRVRRLRFAATGQKDEKTFEMANNDAAKLAASGLFLSTISSSLKRRLL